MLLFCMKKAEVFLFVFVMFGRVWMVLIIFGLFMREGIFLMFLIGRVMWFMVICFMDLLVALFVIIIFCRIVEEGVSFIFSFVFVFSVMAWVSG